MRAAFAVLTTLLAWLVAGTQISATLHFALISHEVCVEHGELVEAGAGAPSEHDSTHAPAPLTVRADGDHAGHDHCLMLGRPQQQPATLTRTALELAPPPAIEIGAAHGTDAPSPSRAERLLSAPKQSPPV